MKLAPLLFVRPGELRIADWADIRLHGADPEYRIPAARMKMRQQMTGHGFRTIASTCLNELFYPPDIIELQLAHAERNETATELSARFFENECRSFRWLLLVEGV